jgi:hypothetical protein
MDFVFDAFLAAFALNCAYALLGYFIRRDVKQLSEFHLGGPNPIMESWRSRWLYFRFLWSKEAIRHSARVKLLVIAARAVIVLAWAILLTTALFVWALFYWR